MKNKHKKDFIMNELRNPVILNENDGLLICELDSTNASFYNLYDYITGFDLLDNGNLLINVKEAYKSLVMVKEYNEYLSLNKKLMVFTPEAYLSYIIESAMHRVILEYLALSDPDESYAITVNNGVTELFIPKSACGKAINSLKSLGVDIFNRFSFNDMCDKIELQTTKTGMVLIIKLGREAIRYLNKPIKVVEGGYPTDELFKALTTYISRNTDLFSMKLDSEEIK